MRLEEGEVKRLREIDSDHQKSPLSEIPRKNEGKEREREREGHRKGRRKRERRREEGGREEGEKDH